ncbi:MAG: hypothetical protein EA352_12455 [Gemmatimonadales bacterium]|nr:MAG: hypothetical protein EA352_12455 [Gemmatimonadales bacterium]
MRGSSRSRSAWAPKAPSATARNPAPAPKRKRRRLMVFSLQVGGLTLQMVGKGTRPEWGRAPGPMGPNPEKMASRHGKRMAALTLRPSPGTFPCYVADFPPGLPERGPAEPESTNPPATFMAKRPQRPTGQQRPDGAPRPQGTADDAFTARILVLVGWARRNAQTVLIAGVALVVLVVGGLYLWQQRTGQYAEAAAQLEVVQQSAMMAGSAEEAVSELETYLARFSGTPYGIEARLMLAEIHLGEGNVAEAIRTLREVAPSYRGSLEVQATFLLATAHEEAEEWEEALTVFRELEDRAEFSFQRKEALRGVARASLAAGDTAAARSAYQALVEKEVDNAQLRGYFEMRLAELGDA